ncbi:MAG: TolC family protein [Marinilabiliaceae bacterium]
MIRTIIATFTFLGIAASINAQDSIRLNLEDAIRLAQSQSLQSLINKHDYLADYWQYKSFRADYLPEVSLNSNPVAYNNASRLRYNSNTQTEEFVQSEEISSDLNVDVSQKLPITGGRFFVQSELARIENFGQNSYTQYSAVPVRIGYSQELFGFNPMKWEQTIEPLKFKKAKKEYVMAMEETAQETIDHFFKLLSARFKLDMARYNVSTTEELLEIARKRIELGTLTREELIDLRLSANNAKIEIQEARLAYREAKENLLNFLMLPAETGIKTELPEQVPIEETNPQKVLEEARENNPQILEQEQKILESKRNVAEAKSDRHFRADLNMSFGLSKNDGTAAEKGTIGNAYSPEFENYQQVNIGINIPILDWGKNKGRFEMARSRQKVAETAAQKVLQEFEQDVVTSAISFNIQQSKLESSAVSDTLAKESYQLTMTRFKQGKTDVLKLNTSQKAKDKAQLQYINAMAEYWNQYYYLRKLTLYDFKNEQEISFDPENPEN